MDETYKILNSYNYSKNQINRVLKCYLLMRYTDETLANVIKNSYTFFEGKDHSANEIKKMTLMFPSIFAYSEEKKNLTYTFFEKKGYSAEEIKKMTLMFPTIFSYGEEKRSLTYTFFEKKSYSADEIKKMILARPAIFGNGKKKKTSTYTFFEEKRYSAEEIKKIILMFPQIIGYSIKKKDLTYTVFEENNYSVEEIKKIVLELPQILGYSKENKEQKLYLYQKLDIKKHMIKRPKDMMQSTNLTYCRWLFLNDINFYNDNPLKLFASQKQFKKQHGHSNIDIKEKYKDEFQKFSEDFDAEKVRKKII